MKKSDERRMLRMAREMREKARSARAEADEMELHASQLEAMAGQKREPQASEDSAEEPVVSSHVANMMANEAALRGGGWAES